MEISELVNAITDVGILIVIAAIFLYVVIKFINLGFKYLSNKLGEKTHNNNLDIRNNVNQKIQKLLQTAINQLDVKRIEVIEFSNSVMSVANMPFKYMTCTYEVYKLGETAVGHKIDRISTSLFTSFFAKLQSQEYFIFEGTEENHQLYGAMYDLLQEQKETKSLCDMMKTNKGKAIGYITMTKTEDFTEADIETIQSLSERVCALLSVLDC